VIGISTWYADLGEYSFPTLFVRLDDEEIESLTAGQTDGPAPRRVARRLQEAIRHMTGAAFVGADVCAPTDSPCFRYGRWISFGKSAWKLLASSEKVKSAFLAGHTRRLTVRPFRRMDRAREFRMFIQNGRLTAMCQYHLDLGYLPRIAARRDELWRSARRFVPHLTRLLPARDIVIDVYLRSSRRWLLLDLNPWGPPTDPLLLRRWDRDWSDDAGLLLAPRPVRMQGDIEVSF